MEDLTREEKIEKRIKELERQIYEKDNAFDREQGKRIKSTFLVLCGVIYLIAFMLDGMNNIEDYLGWIILAPITAGIILFISFLVTLYIDMGAMKRVETISKLKAELNTIKYFDKFYK